MKKVLSVFLSIIMLLSITAGLNLSVYAYNGECTLKTSGNYEYYLYNDGTVHLKKYIGPSTSSLTLPKTIDGYKVVSTGERTFENRTDLTNVTIPNGIVEIGMKSFLNCKGLRSVTISNSVTSIGISAFENCEKLTDVVIPNSVTSIGDLAFYMCESLTSIEIPYGVTNIGKAAFRYCTNLSNIVIHDSVTSIGNLAFGNTAYYSSNDNYIDGVLYIDNYCIHANAGFYSLSTYQIRNGTIAIADSAFTSFRVKEVIVPKGLKYIGAYAFYSNKELTNIKMADDVISIGKDAFEDCNYLKNIELSSNLINISHYTFKNCVRLKSITIPDSVKSIGAYAFQSSGLESVLIPSGVSDFSRTAFYDCSSLKSIVVDKNNRVYDSRDNCNAVIKTDINQLIEGCENTKIPLSVTSIGDMAFYCCRYLNDITIPKNVTNIGTHSFHECSSLNSVIIENEKCSIASSLSIPKSATIYGRIGSTAESYAKQNGNKFIEFYDGCAHNWDNGIVTQTATCTIDGVKTIYCTKCNATKTESLKATGHEVVTDQAVSATCTTAGKTAGSHCSICNTVITAQKTIAATGHKLIIQEAVAPTCTRTGKTEGSYCSLCYATITEQKIVPKAEHNYGNGKITKYPTCFEEGTIIYSCNDCGTVKKEALAPTGHNYDKGKVTKTSTCMETGVRVYTCMDCNAKKTEVIPLAEHSLIIDPAKAPTCTTTGKTAGSHCYVCNAVVATQKTVAATGHSYDNGRITKSATCKANGTKILTCTTCGETKTETISKTAHTYKTTTTKATTKKNGSIVKKCSNCGTSSKTTIYYPKTISLSKTSYVYNGKAQKPTVTVKDCKGKKIAASNYTVTYASGRKNVGIYTVTIKFKGNYSGTVKKTFTIKPKATTLSSVTAKSKGFTAKWKKLTTQTTGYQIQYSTSSKFSSAKTVTISKNSTTSKAVSKLKAKKKYYVRVRTYKTVKVNGKSTKIYSSWSKSKSVTTKK